jgi:WD40 repeat protein/tRNA A-37 threonylcarbamoyl transferase component Bud32
MPDTKCCAECGAPLPTYWPKGLCAQCALDGALDMTTAASQVIQPEAPTTPGSVQPVPSSAESSPLGSFGDYDLLEEIARGGMGVVYKARQRKLGRIVAVKMILAGPQAGKEFVQRFRTESAAAAILQHPNIVAIHDVGVHEGRHYFSMDYVEGQNLAQRVGQQPLPANKAARYGELIAEAIHYAHERGILHRDLKPSNVLIDLNDQPHVTDFGLAKRFGVPPSRGTGPAEAGSPSWDITVTGQVLGSPSFMPPEQAGAKRGKVGRPSDVYALGGILFYLLTARAPFQAESLEGIITQVLHAEPVSPHLLNPSIPKDLETITLKCLEKEPARRYQTAKALADELGRFLRREPILARPVNAPEKLWRWCRRKPAFASALGFAIGALLVGVAATSWQWRRAEGNAVKERHERERAETGEGNARRLLYASDMNLAQQSLKLNNLGRARRLLERHRPQPGEEDLRGWEWRYLWQLTRSSALVTLTNRPTTRGFSVSFSPDGTRLAVGWYDGRVDLWDVPGRRLVRALTAREYAHQGRVAFSPVSNLLAATSESKVVTLYDLDSGRESIFWQAPDGGAWNVRDLSFSPDGSRVVIYAGSDSELADEVWVVNVPSSQIESRHSTRRSSSLFYGAARLSPDNRRLYLARSDDSRYRHTIQCLDLTTGQELWQTKSQPDPGLTTLAVSPDGRLLASGSGFEDPTIRVWDAATGGLLYRLDGHTGFVCKLAFTRDGQRLISAASDQSIRFWDTSTWTETQVLRGHTDEVHAVAVSEPAQLVASAGKDGNLLLWQDDGKSAADGYTRLPEELGYNQVLPLDHARVLLLHADKPPTLVDLKRGSAQVSLPEIGSSSNVLGFFGTNIFCHWNGTNQILVRELRDMDLIQRASITVDSGTRPLGLAYNATRQLLAWTEGTSSAPVYLENLAARGRRIELRSDVPELVPYRFSDDGNFLAARGKEGSLYVWNVETRQNVASINQRFVPATFAAGGRLLVVTIEQGQDHEIRFYDLAHPDRPPRCVPGRYHSGALAVSPDGGLVASSTDGGLVRLFAPAKGELIESVHGHLNAAVGIAFSADGRRLISTSIGREAAKLWDVGTWQELLTLGGTGSWLNAARWSADGDVILAGAPWQAWRAPSWEEIAAAEAKEKTEIKQP